jgi:hypothetical protein
VNRTYEFTGRQSHIIKTSVRPWEYDDVKTGDYAVDVMRRYPDPNEGIVQLHCNHLGIPLIPSQTDLPWEEFKKAIAQSRFLVSAKYEASTGGLTLMEGLWHGKPILFSNSPRYGAKDYLWPNGQPREWSVSFQWDDPLDFRRKLLQMYDHTPVVNIDEARQHIMDNHSELAMAKAMANRFWELHNAGA